MKKLKQILMALVVAFCLATGAYLVPNAAYAADEASTDYKLVITPTQKSFGTMQPGETYSDSFMVRNAGKEPFDFSIEFTPYSVKGESYEADYTTETQYTEIVNWLSADHTSGSVEPGQEAKVTYTIKVPADAHGGAQVGTIMVTMADQAENDDTSGVKAVRRLGYVVSGNVDGEITRTAKILENKIPSFIFTPPIAATSLVENTGNIYTNASYTLQVFPLFSDEEVYTNEDKPEQNVIFPETTRYSTISWEGAPHLGIFRVKQTIKIFDEVSEVEKLVFLCPLWFIVIILLLIFLIIFWIVSRIRNRRKE